MDIPALAPSTRPPRKVGDVYGWLRQQIMLSHYAPGQAVAELEVAAVMACSQGTVREAMLRLQEDGLIVRNGYRGTVVTPVSATEGPLFLKWRAQLPYQPAVKIKTPGAAVAEATVKSFCTAGDFAFGVESRTATVHVFALADGKKIGEMTPGPEVGRESGWVDFPDALRATKRPGGEYLVFVEEDAKAKVLVYRWTPKP